MCSICGLIDYNKSSSHNDLKSMNKELIHRGPDSSDSYFEEYKDFSIGLASNRLSIIDLSKNGNQPSFFDGLILIFNGELYNYKEIKIILENYGYTFNSTSDTEVVLKSFHKWGIDAISKFNGEYAISLFDTNKMKLYLIRDKSGVKPLYYYFNNGLLLFASELKSFHKHLNFIKDINKIGLEQYFTFGYIMQPLTIFNNTYKLESGSVLTYNLNYNEFEISKYFDILNCYNKDKFVLNENEILSETDRLLKISCNYTFNSDVSNGIYLSGGYDSSLITAILQTSKTERLKTYSVKFLENKFDESHYSSTISTFLNTDHNIFNFDYNDFYKLLPSIPEIFDEPFADESMFPTLFLNASASNHIKVAITGDGADELFGGYNKYNQIQKFNNIRINFSLLNKLIYKKFFINIFNDDLNYKTNKFFNLISSENIEDLSYEYQRIINKNDLSNLFSFEQNTDLINYHKVIDFTSNFSNLDKLLINDFNNYLPNNILQKLDKCSTAYSIEGRVPYLDNGLVDFITNIDCNKINYKSNKYLLKQLTHKYIPEKYFNKSKKGFDAPIYKYLQNLPKSYLNYYLNYDRLKKSDIYNMDEIKILLNKNYFKSYHNYKKIYLILIFELWREKWFNL